MIILKNKRDDGSYLQMTLPKDAAWPEVVDDFVNFLQGCGYIVQGVEIAEYLMEQYSFQKAEQEKEVPKSKVRSK